MRHVSKGLLSNFLEGYYVLVAREEFFEAEKLCLRWRVPRRIIKANEFVLNVEYLSSEKIYPIHGSRLKYYSESCFDKMFIMAHIVNIEIGMPVVKLVKLVKFTEHWKVQVRWKMLFPLYDTL